MASPSTKNPTADGTTKNATRGSAAFNLARSRAKASSPLLVSRDISGSSAAEMDMPNRLIGSR
jgi:hypothetical protein